MSLLSITYEFIEGISQVLRYLKYPSLTGATSGHEFKLTFEFWHESMIFDSLCKLSGVKIAKIKKIRNENKREIEFKHTLKAA